MDKSVPIVLGLTLKLFSEHYKIHNMDSQIVTTTIPQASLAPTVFSILDSRIQFLEYQIKVQFDPKNQGVQNHLLAYDQLMVFYKKTCTALKLLQILKEWVRDSNAAIILNLLHEDSYLNYSEKQLERMVENRAYDLIHTN